MNYQKGIVNVILIIAIVALAGFGGYYVAKDKVAVPTPAAPVEEKVIPQTAPVSNITSYSNTDLGISFDYPKDWGTVTKSVEKGCFGAASQAGCDNITLSFSAHNTVTITSASSLFVQNPNPRGGSLSDTMIIKSQADITNFCANRVGRADTSDCAVKTNKNGVMYAQALLKSCSEVSCDTDVSLYYYMKLTGNNFSGLALKMLPGDKEAIAVIDTLAVTI